jgi:hypothetical protein
MTQPNRTQTHIDKFLTDTSIGFLQNPGDFIAGSIVPTKTVRKQSDRYARYTAADFARDDMRLRMAGEESQGTGYTLSNDSYFCDKFAGHVDITYDDVINADDPIDLEKDSVELLSHNALIRRERLFAEAAWGTGKWTTDILGSATTKFDDYLNSDPIRVIDNLKRGIHLRTFRTPNVLALGYDVFLALKEHPDLVSRVQYTSQDSIDEVMMARRFGVDKVVVAKSVLNEASEGLAASMDYLLDSKSALLMYSPAAVRVMTPAAIVNFAWTGAEGLPRPNGVVARAFDMDAIQSRRVEMEICHAFKVTAPDLGAFLSHIVD